jgi:chemotaxis protein MotB
MAKKHGGHHGGSWKVAYADFVTAMMALFLVLWLTSQDEKIKEAIQRSFTNPFASLTKESTGIIPQKDTPSISRDKSGNFDSSSAVELAMLRRLSDDLLKALEKEEVEPEDQKPTKLDLTPEGLRISIFDRSRRPIFKPQSAEFTPYGDWVMSTLAWQISLYASFTVELEGHTETGRKPVRADYGDWEISSDRASASRRKLIEHGVSTGQIRKVAGFGDTVPMADVAPEDESNRRITVMLKIRSGNNTSA